MTQPQTQQNTRPQLITARFLDNCGRGFGQLWRGLVCVHDAVKAGNMLYETAEAMGGGTHSVHPHQLRITWPDGELLLFRSIRHSMDLPFGDGASWPFIVCWQGIDQETIQKLHMMHRYSAPLVTSGGLELPSPIWITGMDPEHE